jgi:hypothetical protein
VLSLLLLLALLLDRLLLLLELTSCPLLEVAASCCMSASLLQADPSVEQGCSRACCQGHVSSVSELLSANKLLKGHFDAAGRVS